MALPAVLSQDNGHVALTRLLNSKIRDAFSLSIEAANADPDSGASRPPDLAASFDVLDRAAKGIVTLAGNLKQINDFVAQREIWADTEIERLRAEAEEAKRITGDMDTKLRNLQRQLEAATQRADAAEDRARATREALLSLHERVLAVLGAGSDVDEALSGFPALQQE